MDWDLLAAQDSNTSNGIIDFFGSDATFVQIAEKETAAIMQRDDEDDEKLAQGIKVSLPLRARIIQSILYFLLT